MHCTSYLLSDRDTTSCTGMGAGGNGNNKWEWEGNSNKTWLNLESGIGLKRHSRLSLRHWHVQPGAKSALVLRTTPKPLKSFFSTTAVATK